MSARQRLRDLADELYTMSIRAHLKGLVYAQRSGRLDVCSRVFTEEEASQYLALIGDDDILSAEEEVVLVEGDAPITNSSGGKA